MDEEWETLIPKKVLFMSNNLIFKSSVLEKKEGLFKILIILVS